MPANLKFWGVLLRCLPVDRILLIIRVGVGSCSFVRDHSAAAPDVFRHLGRHGHPHTAHTESTRLTLERNSRQIRDTSELWK